MKKVYPVIFTPCEEGGYMVTVPDFPLNTQGGRTWPKPSSWRATQLD